MVYIRSRTFCCCIPVRFGVVILSLLSVVGGAIISAAGWVQVYQLRFHRTGTADTIAVWLHTSIFMLLTLLSLFGFVGCLVKSRNSISAYACGLLAFVLMSIFSGAFTLWALFNRPSTETDYQNCLNGATDATIQAMCGNGGSVYKGIAVTVYILVWLLLIYAYVIASNYVEQLDEEEQARDTRALMSNIGQPRVAVPPVAMPAYASFGPTAQRSAPGYSFAYSNQSFGNATSRPNGSMV